MVRLSDPPAIIEFGSFSILPHRRQLLADGRPIRLGGRAFDLLLALLEVPGAVVSKDELLSRIWPGRIVEETGCRARFRRYGRPSGWTGTRRFLDEATNSPARSANSGRVPARGRFLRPWRFPPLALQPTSPRAYPN